MGALLSVVGDETAGWEVGVDGGRVRVAVGTVVLVGTEVSDGMSVALVMGVIDGVGVRRLDSYGIAFLEVIRRYAEELGE